MIGKSPSTKDVFSQRNILMLAGALALLAVLSASLLIEPLRNIENRKRTQLWPTVNGKIEKVDLKIPWYRYFLALNSTSTIKVDAYLSYSYESNTKKYSGRCKLGEDLINMELEGTDIIQKRMEKLFPVGGTIIVRCDPRNAVNSIVFDKSDPSKDLRRAIIVCLAIPGILIGLGFAIAIYAKISTRGR